MNSQSVTIPISQTRFDKFSWSFAVFQLSNIRFDLSPLVRDLLGSEEIDFAWVKMALVAIYPSFQLSIHHIMELNIF